MKGQYNLDTRINEKSKSRYYISEITVAELLYGASCSNRKEKILKEVEQFISHFTVLPIYESLSTYADLKAILRSKGLMIDDFDMLIGASAIKNSLVLVTDNVKHFERIPHIQLENWINRR
jgi:tRNA(fMet)-specific endonuclease VapC